MENIIIIGVLAVLILFGIRSAIKHFKGEGGCCGGRSSLPPQNKKLENVIATKTISIEGMTCDHCRSRVEKCINDIDGAAATVSLNKKEALVSMSREIGDEVFRTAIEKAGYTVVKIQ